VDRKDAYDEDAYGNDSDHGTSPMSHQDNSGLAYQGSAFPA
jgi:hypothetical protein